MSESQGRDKKAYRVGSFDAVDLFPKVVHFLETGFLGKAGYRDERAIQSNGLRERT